MQICDPQQLSSKNWAPVSEPGFSDFQIFRFVILDICFVCKICSGNMLVRSRGINNKRCPRGTLDKIKGFESHFENIEVPIYRQMLKSGLSDTM